MPSNVETITTSDNKTVYKLTYSKFKKKKAKQPESDVKEVPVDRENAINEASVNFPEIYTHDGETYL